MFPIVPMTTAPLSSFTGARRRTVISTVTGTMPMEKRALVMVAVKAAQAAKGAEVSGFEQALLAAYDDMAKDVARIRKNREARRAKMKAEPKG